MNRIGKQSLLSVFYCFIGFLSLFFSTVCFAITIVVQPNTVIAASKTYDNVNLDMTNGSFLIKNNATLTIKNSTINGTLSDQNPILFNAEIGNLYFENNTVSIQAVGITPHPLTQSMEYVMQMASGNIKLSDNRFSIDQPFSAGLLITTASIPTTGFQIKNNQFKNFHGVLYLVSSDNALVKHNIFLTNSYGHIVNIGNNSVIDGNQIYFSGNDHLGNAIDVIDSENVSVIHNQILTPTCHGIYVLTSRNLLIDSNNIHGGITYAMNIYSHPETASAPSYLPRILLTHKLKNTLSGNIIITNNYMSLNRYGIAASDVDGLYVRDNNFIQRFTDDETRRFWTDNKVLLTNVTNLTWTNNLYKEGFTQENGGDNSKSLTFVPFPATGGVTL